MRLCRDLILNVQNVDSIDEIGQVQSLIEKLKTDSNFYNMLSTMSRDRLIDSNKAEYKTMLSVLCSLGFDVDRPEGLYW